MKVVAFNGSPRAKGNTYNTLKMVGDVLETEGIEFEIIHVGNQEIRGCLSCFACFGSKDEQCIIKDDKVNEWIQKMKEADGIILGSPTYFAGVAGTMKAFLDRAFLVAGVNGTLRHKVGASVVAVRRTGGMTTYNSLNSYINYCEMVMPASNYWNVVHGMMPNEVAKDEEGKQTMEVLGKNMAWLIKLIENGKGIIDPPKAEAKKTMNFIR